MSEDVEIIETKSGFSVVILIVTALLSLVLAMGLVRLPASLL